MKRCAATLRTTRSWQARRWASYDKSALAPEVLHRKVEASLGYDTDGNPLRVDTESGTVSTAAGDLPISPLFDTAWIKPRRRQRKEDPSSPTGRFRKKLTLNPYARALATPIRHCGFTKVVMPRYFLQDIEIISHPTTGRPWYAPGPLAFDRVQPIHRPSETPAESSDGASGNKASTDAKAKKSDRKTEKELPEEPARADGRPRRAPLTSYILSRKDILDPLSSNAKLLGGLFALRQGAAWSNEFRMPVWREDMPELVLGMMRRTIVDTLITRANREHGPKDKFIEPVSSWETVKDVKRRQSVLWLPRENVDGPDGATTTSDYATLDVDGVQYYRKMAVHNLPWMLGSEEMARLKESAPAMFDQHEILVLKGWGSQSMVNLHLLLWRLQGYLAKTTALPADSSTKAEPKEDEATRGTKSAIDGLQEDLPIRS